MAGDMGGEFQEVALAPAPHQGVGALRNEDQLLPRRARSGGGGGGVVGHFDGGSNPGAASSTSVLPSISQPGQSNSYPNSTNGRGRVHPAYNMAGVSPPSSLTAQQIMIQQGQRANSAGLAHGRVDWKAKYLK